VLGLIVLAVDGAPGLPARTLLDNLLGAPLLARAIAGALPADEAVTGVLVVPEALVEVARTQVVERFGLDEIDRVIAGGPNRRAALQAGLEALPADVDIVLVQDGARVLVPAGLADRIAAAARSAEAACPAVNVPGQVVADEGGQLTPLDVRPRLRALQAPQAFRLQALKAAVANGQDDLLEAGEASLIANAGATVVLVPGDEDNLLLKETADLSRALEVFSRRAVDYAFLYPRDLLPEDPLAKALDASEALDNAPETIGSGVKTLAIGDEQTSTGSA
jgi:2-C-methyl-D-erythritol 4-phosphate cytidylyltransferase